MSRLIAFAAAMLAAPAAPAVAAPQAQATVTLAGHRYTPAPIYLAGGVPVRLILVNRAASTHDFTAPQFFRTARLVRGRAPGGKVRLEARRSATLDLVPVRGTYKVHCTRFGHRMLGMSTMIIVL